MKLSQLQHWLTHPKPNHQQEALAHQLQEAEQQLAQSRRQAEECEQEVQQATQQQLSIPSIPANSAKGIDSGIAGTAALSLPNSTPSPAPALTGDQVDRQHNNNRFSKIGHSIHSTGSKARAAGASGAPTQAAQQDPTKLMQSAKRSRGRNVWQPASGASTSTAAMTSPAATLATLSSRSVLKLEAAKNCYFFIRTLANCFVLLRHVVCFCICRSPEPSTSAAVKAATEQLQELQHQLMQQQAELGWKRAAVQVRCCACCLLHC